MASRTSTDPLEILLEMGVDLDDLSEQDYLGALMEAVATIEFQTKGKGDARSAVLRKEIVNVRKKRKAADPKFKAKKTKISASSFKKNSATGSSVAPKALPTSAIVAYQAPAADKDNKKEKEKKKEEPKNLLAEIAESVSNIADILQDQYNLKKQDKEFDRKKAQRDKRKLDKENLTKGFGALLKTFDKVTKPVTGFFDTIFNFIKNILLGKFLMGLVDFISKPENQKKLKNILSFLGKHWKKLLSLYLVFGTGLGRFVFGFSKILITGAVKLTAAIASLLAAKKLRGFGKLAGAARFLKGRAGIIGAGVATAVTVGGTMKGMDSLGLSEGGLVQPIFNFFRFNGGGEVGGPSGTDKVPAMLTDGEFVMSRGAVQKYGVAQLEAMNAAGGGTNIPKVMDGTMYASGGGSVRGSGAGSPEGGYSSGSLMSSPLGAIDRMLGQSTGGRVRLPGRSSPPPESSSSQPKPRVQPKDPVIPSPSSKPPSSSEQETSKDQTAAGIPERMLKSPTFRDSGLLYLRSMLGGLGGPITESQLSEASKVELNNAIARAKLRRADELAKAEQQLQEAKDGGFNKQVLAERQSVRDRLKRGEIRVLYKDYYDGNDEKNITPAAENAKSILGQFWATSTEKGGYRVVNEKYDFRQMNDPMAVLRNDSRGIAEDPKKAVAGEEITLRQKLQALHQLNPLAREMSVDMILGEKPNPKRDLGNIMKYTVGGIADFFTLNSFDFDRQGGSTLMNPSGQEDKARKKVDKQLSTLQGMSKQQVLNAQRYAESKGKYFSSTDGKTYESYQAAVDAQKSKSAPSTPSTPSAASAKPAAPSMSQAEALNAQKYAASKGKYYSSADGKTYPNYQAAVDAQTKFHKGGMVMGRNKPKLPTPGAPVKANVTVIRVPKPAGSDATSPAPRGGSRTPDINAGNGSASKRKILGIV